MLRAVLEKNSYRAIRGREAVPALGLPGKVVVLTFTTTDCVPCLKSYPALRDMARRFGGRPFALLSAYAARDRNDVKKAVAAGDITWRCWWDRGGYGPICSAWGVDGFPVAYVLDARGVVRFKASDPESLARAAEGLLKERKK